MPSRAHKALIPVVAMAAAAVLTLSGCSGKADEKAPSYEDGPLTKYFAAIDGGGELTDEIFQEQQREIEELVAVCMQKEGFEYKPDTQNYGSIMSSDDEDGPQWGSKEFAEQYGYGFTDSPGMTSAEEDTQEYVDPNGDYLATLSESEQNAFYETLYGAGPTEEQMAEMEEGGSYTSDWTQEGCQGAARHEVGQKQGGTQAAYEDPEFADLFAAMQDIWNTENNEEMAKLDSEWASCMADSGYPDFSKADDAQMSIMEASNELYSGGGEYVEGEEPKEPSKKELDALKKREIELAVADFDCKKKVGYEEKQIKVMHEIEQKFVDENKAQLDAMLAKYQTKSGAKSEGK